jgi:hypothetical protein
VARVYEEIRAVDRIARRCRGEGNGGWRFGVKTSEVQPATRWETVGSKGKAEGRIGTKLGVEPCITPPHCLDDAIA